MARKNSVKTIVVVLSIILSFALVDAFFKFTNPFKSETEDEKIDREREEEAKR